MSEAKWIFLAASCAGLVAGALVLSFSDNGDHPAARLARCSMGFLLAMVWIMAIADEVVKVLQASPSSVSRKYALLLTISIDLRLHFWTLGRDHWANYFRRRELVG